MRVKTIVDEDFTNYKKPSMLIGSISCAGKCCTEAGIPLSVCHNDEWRFCAIVDIPDDVIFLRYLKNSITQAIVIAGLEPMEQFPEVYKLIQTIRKIYKCGDDIVIYTGYYPDEITSQIEKLCEFQNIIVKFGRYIPNKPHRYDDILGVELASDNQYARRIS